MKTKTATRKELTVYYRRHSQLFRRCGLCGGAVKGGSSGIKHKRDCLLADPDVMAVELKAVADPATVCTKCKGDGEVNHWWGPDESEIIQCDKCKGSGKHVKTCTHPDLLQHHGCKLCSVKACGAEVKEA